VMLIIFVSLIPLIVEFVKHRFAKKK
jgi:hypothetical protein